jgi:hypothetical protein
LHHLAGDLDVDGVDVVEQAGGEEAADLEDEPGEEEKDKGAWAPTARGCGLRRDFRHWRFFMGLRLVSHEVLVGEFAKAILLRNDAHI